MTVHAEYTGNKVNTEAIHAEFRSDGGPVGRELDRLSQLVLDEARRLVPVRTGTLLASIRRESGTGPLGPYRDITAGVPGLTNYLGFVLDGTEPHVIYPSRRKALRFISGGRVIFSTRVSHPGTRPNPFLTRSLDVLR